MSDDTDILCLLLHHSDHGKDSQNIFMKNMTCKNDTDKRLSYNIHDIITKTDPLHLKYILFAHAFTGCDTTSSIYNFGKIAILTKLKNQRN